MPAYRLQQPTSQPRRVFARTLLLQRETRMGGGFGFSGSGRMPAPNESERETGSADGDPMAPKNLSIGSCLLFAPMLSRVVLFLVVMYVLGQFTHVPGPAVSL